MLVYRSGRQRTSGEMARRELARAIREIHRPEAAVCLEALLRAGDLECALADARGGGRAEAEGLTSALAVYLLSSDETPPVDARAALAIDVPERIEHGRPEGFAYYGLDPRAYARLGFCAELRAPRAAVIGVRSIGTSLSAVVRAALLRRGIEVERSTVRPGGHPFGRTLSPGPEELRFVNEHAGAHFFVVDEGPGLSGSTFLAVGEALVELGVPAERVTFLCSRPVDADRLIATEAPRRFRRFESLVASGFEPPLGARDLSAGRWREAAFAAEGEWPACWAARERIKFRLPGAAALSKFEGFSPYHEGPRRRAELLADAGFGPRPEPSLPGFISYAWCEGTPQRAGSASRELVRALARYTAFRGRELGVSDSASADLETMTRVNLAEALGRDPPRDFRLPVVAPAYVDGRMAPHEWVAGPSGVLKVDAVDHGDDHLFPGPTDIAWDLAGAAVEWELADHGVETLLREYRLVAGDDARTRFGSYLIAYCAFQIGCTSFAAAADAVERPRLELARERYERALLKALPG